MKILLGFNDRAVNMFSELLSFEIKIFSNFNNFNGFLAMQRFLNFDDTISQTIVYAIVREIVHAIGHTPCYYSCHCL